MVEWPGKPEAAAAARFARDGCVSRSFRLVWALRRAENFAVRVGRRRLSLRQHVLVC